MFKDRQEAAYLLAKELKKYNKNDAIVLAIPRGAVPMGSIIAKELDLPLEVVLSKKIGHPSHKEYAIGAVTLNSRILSEGSQEVSKDYIEEETIKIRELLKKRQNEYYGKKVPETDYKDKILILVDDGIATGNTILSTIAMLHQAGPKKLVVAIPVAPPSGLQKLHKSPFVDDVICLLTPWNFSAVGQFYENFDQVDDEEVIEILKNAKKQVG